MLTPSVEIEGNLVIQWHERGAFDVCLVPRGAIEPPPVTNRHLPDLVTLGRFLAELGIHRERIQRVLRSPYVLQSLPVRVDGRKAARLGLVPTPAWRRALDRLADVMREPARLTRLIPRRPPPER
ncbi:MAG: hypothetical protein HY002_07680 [Candidatus Rokubacteria bacterium]|nr:hypothetical protein [Candidatus Rokubacteria bacterium]